MRVIYLLIILAFFGITQAQDVDSIHSRSFMLRFNSLSEEIRNQVDSLLDLLGSRSNKINKSIPEEASRPFLGIVFESVEDNDDKPAGVKVLRVVDGSSASIAGLQEGDHITGIDGISVHSAGDIISIMRGKKVNDHIEISYIRNGGVTLTTAILLPNTDIKPFDRLLPNSIIPNLGDVHDRSLFGYIQQARPKLGVHIADLNDTNIKTLGLKRKAKGVLVKEVDDQSPAHAIGLLPNDVIVMVNNIPVHNTTGIIELMKEVKLGDAISVTYIRNKKRYTGHGELTAYNPGWQSEERFSIFRIPGESNEIILELEELRDKIKMLEDEIKRIGNQ